MIAQESGGRAQKCSNMCWKQLLGWIRGKNREVVIRHAHRSWSRGIQTAQNTKVQDLTGASLRRTVSGSRWQLDDLLWSLRVSSWTGTAWKWLDKLGCGAYRHSCAEGLLPFWNANQKTESILHSRCASSFMPLTAVTSSHCPLHTTCQVSLPPAWSSRGLWLTSVPPHCSLHFILHSVARETINSTHNTTLCQKSLP